MEGGSVFLRLDDKKIDKNGKNLVKQGNCLLEKAQILVHAF